MASRRTHSHEVVVRPYWAQLEPVGGVDEVDPCHDRLLYRDRLLLPAVRGTRGLMRWLLSFFFDRGVVKVPTNLPRMESVEPPASGQMRVLKDANGTTLWVGDGNSLPPAHLRYMAEPNPEAENIQWR